LDWAASGVLAAVVVGGAVAGEGVVVAVVVGVFVVAVAAVEVVVAVDAWRSLRVSRALAGESRSLERRAS
jgi:hypothetical protein